MKKSFKILVCLILSVATVFGIVACGGNKDTKTVITYMSWNLGSSEQDTLNRKMLKQFELAHPEYRVEIIPAGGTGEYDNNLLVLAGSKSLPDVFMLSNMSFGLVNEMLYNLTSVAEADEDWTKIPAPVEEAARFNGKVYAVPAEMHLHGIFVNENMLDNANYRGSLEPNLSIADFKSALAALNSVGNMASLSGEGSILEWYPAQVDSDLGYYTWDGEKYNLNSSAFAEALSLMQEIRTNKWSYDSWTATEKESSQSTSDLDLFRKNKMAMYVGASYKRNGILYGEEGGTEIIFEGDASDITFVGIPGGRQVIIPDIYGISKNTKNIEGAYKLAKWMSFDPAGITKRIELDTKNEFISLPMTNDIDVIDKYFEKEAFGGLREVFETLDNGIVEPTKIVPGYRASRWESGTGQSYKYKDETTGADADRTQATITNIYDDIWKNSASIQWATVKDGVNTIANNAYNASARALNEMYPKA